MDSQATTAVRRFRTGTRAAVLLVMAVALLAIGVPAVTQQADAYTESLTKPVSYFPLATPAAASNLVLSGSTPKVVLVAGVGGVPAADKLASVVVNVTVNNPSAVSFLKVWADGSTEPPAVMELSAGSTQSSLVTTKVGANGNVAFKAIGTSSMSITAAVIGFHSTQQMCWTNCWYHNRFMPSDATTVYDGRGTPLAANTSVPVQITGRAGVPANATSAVVRVNITPPANPRNATRHIDVSPEGGNISSLLGGYNFNETARASVVLTVGLSSTGRIAVKAPAQDPWTNPPSWVNSPNPATGDLGIRSSIAVEVLGSFVGTAYAPAADGPHPAGVLAPLSLAHNVAKTHDVRGIDGMAQTSGGFGMTSAVMNVTVTGATTAGKLSVGPGNLTNVSFAANQTATNQVIVPVDATGLVPFKFVAQNGSASAKATVTIDFVGYWQFSTYANAVGSVPANGERFTPVTPAAVYTTPSGVEPAGAVRTFDVLGLNGVPSTGVSRVVLQVQAKASNAATTVTFATNGIAYPSTPNLALLANKTASNLVVADVGADGKVAFKVGAGGASVRAVVVGWHTPYVGDGPDNKNVAVFGDSITNLSSGYVQMQNEDTHRLAIQGLSGHQAREVRYWAEGLSRSRADNVIVNLGTNDAYIGGGHTAASTKADVLALLDSHSAAACRYVVTVNANTAPSSGYAAKAQAINAEYVTLPQPGNRVGLIDWNRFLVDNGTATYMHADQLHQSPAGSQKIAEL
jgi:lysophospholipase L1-like esterase